MPDWRFWLPMVVSVVAVGLTGLQWFDSHDAKQLAMRPILTFDIYDDSSEKTVGIGFESNGFGPAIIRSVNYYSDRKPVKDDEEAADHCRLDKTLISFEEYDPGDSVGISPKPNWLFSRHTNNKKELDKFIECVDDHLSIEITYCSIDESFCKTKCSIKGHCH